MHGLLARYPEIAGVGDPTGPASCTASTRAPSGLLRRRALRGAPTRRWSASSPRARVERRYLALVWGALEPPTGHDRRADRAVAPRAAPAWPCRRRASEARTRYEVRGTLSTTRSTCRLLECRLETGRTHQIRVHLRAIGHPVVGDAATAAQGSRSLRRGRGCTPRALRLTHPVTGAELAFDSPLPADLADSLTRLS